jgi:hypothetical protein
MFAFYLSSASSPSIHISFAAVADPLTSSPGAPRSAHRHDRDLPPAAGPATRTCRIRCQPPPTCYCNDSIRSTLKLRWLQRDLLLQRRLLPQTLLAQVATPAKIFKCHVLTVFISSSFFLICFLLFFNLHSSGAAVSNQSACNRGPVREFVAVCLLEFASPNSLRPLFTRRTSHRCCCTHQAPSRSTSCSKRLRVSGSGQVDQELNSVYV